MREGERSGDARGDPESGGREAGRRPRLRGWEEEGKAHGGDSAPWEARGWQEEGDRRACGGGGRELAKREGARCNPGEREGEVKRLEHTGCTGLYLRRAVAGRLV